MKRYKFETERPNEWLTRLREEPRLYGLLLDEAGSLALAARRIAEARCRIHPSAGAVPTGIELHAAAREIQSFVPSVGRVPNADDLASDCDAAGVPVLARCRAA